MNAANGNRHGDRNSGNEQSYLRKRHRNKGMKNEKGLLDNNGRMLRKR